MIFRISNALKNRTKSITCSSLRRFSQQDFISKIPIDQNLLYPFSQSLTSKALRETSSPPSNIFLIDKLSATDSSETYRAYDFDHKTFVAQKSINLDSLASWNQVNLILRLQQQQSSPLFVQTFAIDYDENKQSVKIITELQNTILKDYSLYMKDHQTNWLKERIKPYLMQMIQQLESLKKLGIELEGEKTNIDPQKIFIRKSFQTLKLYDLSDFTVKDTATSQNNQKELLEIAKKTLLKITDVRDMNEVSLVFQEVETEIKQKGILTEPKKSENTLDKGYDQFILNKLLQTAITKDSDISEVITHSDIGRDLRDVFLKHADTYRSKGDFKNAIECYEKAMEAEKNLSKIKEKVKAEAEGFFFDESIYTMQKPKTGLEMVKSFAINVILQVFDFFFMLFSMILGIILLAGTLGLFLWGSDQLFGTKSDESTEMNEKGK